MDLQTAARTRCGGPFPENTGNASPDPDDQSRTCWMCSATACSNWRWLEAGRTEAYIKAVVEHMKTTGDGYNKALQEVLKRRDEFAHVEGFCGIAGGPQTGVGVP